MTIPARVRLTAFYTTVFSAVLILSSVAIYLRVSKSLHQDFYDETVQNGRFMAELFKEELKLNALDEFKEDLQELSADLQILGEQKNSVVESLSWAGLNYSVDEATLVAIREAPVYQETMLNGKPYALFHRAVHIPGTGDYSLHLARSQAPLKRILKTLLEWMLIIQSIMIILAGGIGYLFAARTLRAEEQAFIRLKNFTADASHELRIPLTSLRGNLEVALRKERSNEEYKETIEHALDEAEQLSKLTRDLLLLAQSDAGQLKLNLQDVQVKEFMEDVFAQVQAFSDDKRIKKTLLPVPEMSARFDPDRVRQLLLNLVDNAIKYGRDGGEVLLGAGASGGKTVFTVKDDGIGIAESDLDKIFGRFYRVDKARSREIGGVGLGLSIAHWIVNAHNGSINVESQVGQGTTFTVVL